MTVTIGPTGAYSMVAAATASHTFEGTASVGELWASIPWMREDHAITGDAPFWLRLEPQEKDNGLSGWADRRLTLLVTPVRQSSSKPNNVRLEETSPNRTSLRTVHDWQYR